MSRLKEVFHVAVPTGFDRDENLDTEATLVHISYLKEKGVRSVLVCGSTGEQHSMSLSEKLELLTAIESAEFLSDMEIIFGVSSTRQKEAASLIEAINRSEQVDAILLGLPPYLRPSQEELLAYCHHLIAQSQKPVILYDNLDRTGTTFSDENWVQVLQLEHVMGVKNFHSRDLLTKLKAQLPAEFAFYTGGEASLQADLEAGASRISSIVGNLVPDLVSREFPSLLSGEIAELSSELALRIKDLEEVSVIPYLKKEILENEGIEMYCRAPLGRGL